MSVRRPRTRIYVAMLITLALGFALPPSVNLSHFRGLLSQSLSRSLGRQASVQDVHLRLLPLPGFTFRRLRISDDEEFGGEPILQTQEDGGQSSVATLRLTSLWRGRLEIASVSLTQASLNLVRAPDGHWNLERLINRAAQVPSAPTSRKKPETRARFPYIELKESRINFKFGAEKKPFTLSDSEFSLWLAAENRWNVRLKAIPLRTDESITDTGVVRLSGSFDRASQFAQTPFHFQVSWERPEVNAVLRIARGQDPGWRGTVDLNAEFKGTPADFAAHIDSNIEQFRRYDIARNSSLDLRVSCDHRFRSSAALPDSASQLEFKCKLPLEPGALTAQGKLLLAGDSADFSVRVYASEVPVSALVQAMLHAKNTLPADLTGEGIVDGDWSIEREGPGSTAWEGAITAKNIVLRSDALGPALIFPHSVVLNFEAPQVVTRRTRLHNSIPLPAVARAVIQPFKLHLGGEVLVSASFDPLGYRVNMDGPVDWQRLIQAARAMGLHPPPTDLQGSGVINAQYAGEWRHFAPPVVSGEAQVRSAMLSLRGFSEPLNVSAGTLKFDDANFQAEKIKSNFAQSGLAFVGNFSGTRQCERHVICDVTFSLQTDELQEKAVLDVLNAKASGLALPFFNSGSGFEAKWLLEIPAGGTITAQHVTIGKVQAKNVSAQLQLSGGKLLVRHWTADLFDGQHDGEWTFDFSGPRPSIVGAGSIRHAQMDLVRAALDEQPSAGTLDLEYRLTMSGANLEQLASSAAGSGTFLWRDGVLQTVRPDQQLPEGFHFGIWQGQFTIEKQRVALRNTKMDSPSGIEEVNGEISFSRQWNLRFTRANGSGFVATGSVTNPIVWSETANLTQTRQ